MQVVGGLGARLMRLVGARLMPLVRWSADAVDAVDAIPIPQQMRAMRRVLSRAAGAVGCGGQLVRADAAGAVPLAQLMPAMR